MIRINRKLSSERCLSYVSKRLLELNLSMTDHILCIFTDGTSVMTKIAKIGPAALLLAASNLPLSTFFLKEKNGDENAGVKDVLVGDENSEEFENEDGVGVYNDDKLSLITMEKEDQMPLRTK